MNPNSNPFFPEIQKTFGFGCMRLPMIGEQVDDAQFCQMIDRFLECGFNYFDTAHPYIQGESEKAIKRCLTSRYPRDRYLLTNKLTGPFFEKEEDIRPLFERQLELCGVDYFDFYLMHAQSSRNYDKFTRTHAYEVAAQLKAEGKVRHVGLSFHDTAEYLDMILTQHPEIEVVQLQFNYVDYEDDNVQSRKCYEVCVKHGKPVIVMEPVKGGSLVNLPDAAQSVLRSLNGGSNASYAIRFAAGFDQIMMVLSGMSNMEQMEDNVSFMEHFQPLNEVELHAVHQVSDIIHSKGLIPCTACRYCTDGCPMHISIPDLFTCYNGVTVNNDTAQEAVYAQLTAQQGKASSCIRCGKCEKICPQKLPIRELLTDVAKVFEE